jgi:hypothetical protein
MGVTMKSWLTADDVLSEIEFELVQGTISRNELGRGIQAVKAYQNKVRSGASQAAQGAGEGREVVNRLFQLNDMLITLLQEVAAELRSVRLELRRVARMAQFAPLVTRAAGEPATEEDGEENVDRVAWDGALSVGGPGGDLYGRWATEVEEVENAMRSEALEMTLDVRAIRIPIIGGLIKRLRLALHNLALFYVARLAKRQRAVNRTYGDWVLRLIQAGQQQQEQIDALSAQVAVLQARLTERGHSPPPSARP